ncbi:MAG: S8 family serine peptidase, partial [Acidobacteria bacterium]|nr:S8 family serine peptidase [Acidobacteriota bacterium]
MNSSWKSCVSRVVAGLLTTLASAAVASASSTVPAPAAPSGPAALVAGRSSFYLAGGVSCEPGASPEYQFDWGDGTLSEWRSPAGRNPAAASGVPARAPLAPTAGAIAADLDRLRPLVRDRGRLRVIVGLREPVAPEALLRSSEVRSQQARIAVAQEALLSDLRGDGLRELRRFRTRPAVALSVDEAGLEALGRDPRVARLHEDRMLRPALRESVPAIGAPAAWSAGATGQGQAVAILDAGVDRDHPMLAGRVVAEACYSSNDPFDYEGSKLRGNSLCPGSDSSGAGPGSAAPAGDHGTHVAAIAAGSGSDISGVAPGAAIVGVQVSSQLFDSDWVFAWSSDVLAGMEHVLALSRALPIAAANLSLADTSTLGCNDPADPLALAIADLTAAGIATVAASGNAGLTYLVYYPACLPGAVAVGSASADDDISFFTNANPALDLLAPGEAILSAARGGGLVELSGTSAAAAHVSGAWAVLRSWNPGAPVEEILSALATTGVEVLDLRNWDTARVYPRIQLDRALEALPAGGPLDRALDVV